MEASQAQTRRKGRGPGPFSFLAMAGLLFALLFSGCGLESVTYLSAPTFYSATGSIFLTDTGGAGADILEFEILYRVYQDPSAAQTAINAISSLSASSTESPQTIYYQLKGGSLNLRTALFGSSTADTLKLISAERGISSSFQITTSSLPSSWSVTKLVGTSGLGTTVATAVDSADMQSIGSGGSPYINDLNHLSQSSTDYTPGSTNPAYPPSTAYLVLCAVAKSSSDLFSYSYSLPTPLSSGGTLQLITLNQ